MGRKWIWGLIVLVAALAALLIDVPEPAPPNVPDSMAAKAIAGSGTAPAPAPRVPQGLPLDLLPSPQPLSFQKEPVNLTVTARPDGGWEVADPKSKGTHGSLFVAWAGEDQAMIDWMHSDNGVVSGDSMKQYVIDLRTGALEQLQGYRYPASASPGGRLAVFRTNAEKEVVVDLQKREAIWTATGRSLLRGWLDPDRLLYEQFSESDERSVWVADFRTRTLWQLPEGTSLAASLGGRLCYAFAPKEQRSTVACFQPDTGRAVTLLTPEEQAPGFIQDLWSDPAGRRLAFGYRRSPATGPSRALGLLEPTVAQASVPVQPMATVDTLALYDAEAGLSKRYELPWAGQISILAWSADGAYVSFQLWQKSKAKKGETGELWAVEVATGHMRRLLRFGPEMRTILLRTLPDGSAVVARGDCDKPSVEVVAYGKEPALWQSDMKADTAYGVQPPKLRATVAEPYTMLSDERLDLHLPDGTVATWKLSSPILMGTARADPALRWAYLRPHNGNNLYFLRR